MPPSLWPPFPLFFPVSIDSRIVSERRQYTQRKQTKHPYKQISVPQRPTRVFLRLDDLPSSRPKSPHSVLFKRFPSHHGKPGSVNIACSPSRHPQSLALKDAHRDYNDGCGQRSASGFLSIAPIAASPRRGAKRDGSFFETGEWWRKIGREGHVL